MIWEVMIWPGFMIIFFIRDCYSFMDSYMARLWGRQEDRHPWSVRHSLVRGIIRKRIWQR